MSHHNQGNKMFNHNYSSVHVRHVTLKLSYSLTTTRMRSVPLKYLELYTTHNNVTYAMMISSKSQMFLFVEILFSYHIFHSVVCAGKKHDEHFANLHRSLNIGF